MCLIPDDPQIKLVQINATVSIRPSNSKVSSGKQHIIETKPLVDNMKSFKKLNKKDPEHQQVWN